MHLFQEKKNDSRYSIKFWVHKQEAHLMLTF